MDTHKMTMLFDCVAGSRAYNLSTPSSDYDRRRVITPNDMSYFFGLDRFDVGNVITTKELDSTDYSVQRFVSLAQKCNTVCLELIFAPEGCITYCHPLFRKYFLNNKERFLTKQLHVVVTGYALSERRRALGLTSKDVGLRRKMDIEHYGYSPKNAAHCIRLLWSASEALSTGQFPVRWYGAERDILLNIKLGHCSVDYFLSVYDKAVEEFELASAKSMLPEKNDQPFFSELLVEFYKEFFHI